MNAVRVVIRVAQILNSRGCENAPIRVNVQRATLLRQGRDVAPLKPRERGGGVVSLGSRNRHAGRAAA